MNAGPWLLDALALCLRLIALPFTLVGLSGAWTAAAFILAAGWLAERARRWRQRLWARGQHTDLNPPPGA